MVKRINYEDSGGLTQPPFSGSGGHPLKIRSHQTGASSKGVPQERRDRLGRGFYLLFLGQGCGMVAGAWPG